MRIIKMIFYFPFYVYLVFIMIKRIMQLLKSGELIEDNKKINLPSNWFEKVFFPLLEAKMHLQPHISWIFWIIFALLITLYKI